MTEQSEHLSNAQIENYGNRTSGAGPEAAQRDEPQRVDHQSIADQQMDDQRVEAHLADCASCRNRLLDFHRSLFASSANPPEPDRPKAGKPKNDEPKTEPPENDTSLSGHSSSGHLSSGHSPSSQRPADSGLEGASPTDSALADSKFANSKYPVQAQVRTAPTPECPSDDALRQLAAGLTPDDVAAKLTRHAATCNHCGPLLRTYTEIFSDDFTPEEQAVLANLESASPAWQKDTARQMLEAAGLAAKTGAYAADTNAAGKEPLQQKSFKGSTTTALARKPFFWKWALVPATAVVIAASVVWVYPRWQTQRETEIIASEYAKWRPAEYRLANVPYGNFWSERGSARKRYVKVLDADRKPELSAAAALLRLDSASAITILEDALRFGKSSNVLLDDLVVAYAMEGDRTSDDSYYEKARNLCNEIIDKHPTDAIAYFNRALIEKNLKCAACADESRKDRDHFLRLEKDVKWREDAQERIP